MTTPLSLLTSNQVAEMLQVSRGWVLDHASGRRRPVLPGVKLGTGKSIWRFEKEAVIEWLKQLANYSRKA